MNRRGFGLVEIIIVLAATIIFTTVGYMIYQNGVGKESISKVNNGQNSTLDQDVEKAPEVKTEQDLQKANEVINQLDLDATSTESVQLDSDAQSN